MKLLGKYHIQVAHRRSVQIARYSVRKVQRVQRGYEKWLACGNAAIVVDWVSTTEVHIISHAQYVLGRMAQSWSVVSSKIQRKKQETCVFILQ